MVLVRFLMGGYGYEVGEEVEFSEAQAYELLVDQVVEYVGFDVDVSIDLPFDVEELEDYGEAEEAEPEAEAEDADGE